MTLWHTKYQVSVPEDRSGEWRVERFAVSPEQASLERVRAFNNYGRCVPEGTYTGLYKRNVIVMSDTPDEIRDHIEPIYRAKGQCLVNGLGLGVVVRAMLTKSDVDHVTVVEISGDVINLVVPHLPCADKLTIIHADCFEFKPQPNSRWDAVWHDIWNHLCKDNLPEMHRLHRKYGRRCDWQGSWSRAHIEQWK